MKTSSVFYPANRIENAIRNCDLYPWAAVIRKKAIDAATPYLAMPDDELWDQIYPASLPRAWFVLSYGSCPVCGKSMPMLAWLVDPLHYPWKVMCPHCSELFPKNDFYAYYRSGLDRAGEFSYERADDSLLFNTEHPDPNDPLHKFCVDNGHGWQSDKYPDPHYFIAMYLIYGQWRKVILDGIVRLSEAYTLTGEKAYAHKTAVLLDRLADFFPTYNWTEQGIMYEKRGTGNGYIVYTVASAQEYPQLILAYDRVFEAIREDKDLVTFLSKKAEETGYPNKKLTFSDIQKNIENRILWEVCSDVYTRCACNFPYSHLCDIILRTVADWPNNRADILCRLDGMMHKATAVDGVAGEKGFTDYAAAAPSAIADLFSLFAQIDEHLLTELLDRYPDIIKSFTFHIDAWCEQRYYPAIGDMCGVAEGTETERHFDTYGEVLCSRFPFYPALCWVRSEDVKRSWLWRLYRRTGDVRFVQVQYQRLPQPVTDFAPCSIYDADPGAEAKLFFDLADKYGTVLHQKSVNFEKWHLGMLRAGNPEHERTLWMSYDSGIGHSHKQAMHLGLFAKHLDLMNDFGYLPVHMGEGWTGSYCAWYVSSAAHNTVVVDGKDHHTVGEHFIETHGDTTLWENGSILHAMRFSGPCLIDGPQFERGVYMIELGNDEFYLFDVFRVIGGHEHMKFQHTAPGTMTADGLMLLPTDLNTFNGYMRSYRGSAAEPGWSVDWNVRDISFRPMRETNVHVRMTDLTEDAEGYLAEGWTAPSRRHTNVEWLPRAVTRRVSENEELISNFVDVIEVYEGQRLIQNVCRLPLVGATRQDCAAEVVHADGGKDLLISLDREDVLGLRKEKIVSVADWNVSFEGDFCLVRKDVSGAVTDIVLCGSKKFVIGDTAIDAPIKFAELKL